MTDICLQDTFDIFETPLTWEHSCSDVFDWGSASDNNATMLHRSILSTPQCIIKSFTQSSVVKLKMLCDCGFFGGGLISEQKGLTRPPLRYRVPLLCPHYKVPLHWLSPCFLKWWIFKKWILKLTSHAQILLLVVFMTEMVNGMLAFPPVFVDLFG